MIQENKAYIVQLVKQVVHPYFAGEIADILIAHGMTFKTEPITNADRIRAMSDEDLAALISRSSIHDLCDIVCGGDCNAVATFNKTSEQRCAEIVLEWLQQPAVERER